MIEAFRKIGEKRLKSFGEMDEATRKRTILNSIVLPIPEVYNNKGNEEKFYEVIIDLKKEEDKVEINTENQLRDSNRSNYFAFAAGSSPAGKKFYFNTNNLDYHIKNTIPDMIKLIEGIDPKEEKYSTFKSFLEEYRDLFYQEENGKYQLDLSKISNISGANDFTEVVCNALGITKALFNTYYKSKSIFSLHLDGKHILETKFAEHYINIMYDRLINRFFEGVKGVKTPKISHLSGDKGIVTNNVDIYTKFYMTDKNVFFESFESKKAYKNFTLIKKELEE